MNPRIDYLFDAQFDEMIYHGGTKPRRRQEGIRGIGARPFFVARASRPWEAGHRGGRGVRSGKPSIDTWFFQKHAWWSLRDPSTGEDARATKIGPTNAIEFPSWFRAFVVQNRTKGLLSILMLLSLLLAPSSASAHAFLDRAEPRVGSEVSKSPAEVKIWFTQQPEHAFSTIKVYSGDGKQVDKSDTRTDPDDSKALIVSVPRLPPGTYKVVWKVLSTDTHRTEGSFKFTVKP